MEGKNNMLNCEATMNASHQTEKQQSANDDTEIPLNNINGKAAADKALKLKQKKSRELGNFTESQIINARLRSDSGKVYSTGLTVDSTSQNVNSPTLAAVLEEEGSTVSETEVDMCLKGDCCKNTSKIIDMISKLQESVDGVLKKTSTQEIISSNNTHKIHDLEDACSKNAGEIDDIAGDLKDTQFQLQMVSNIVIRQEQQIGFLKQKITEMQQREMTGNIVISGIPERKNENPIQVFNNFVSRELEIQELIPANKGFRLGSGANRPLLIELRHADSKRKLFSNATKLKGKTNESGSPFFISDHLPEELNEDRRRANELIAENKRKVPSHRLDMNISKGKLIINEEPYKKSVKMPSARDILKPDDATLKTAKRITIVKGDEEFQGRSQFGSFAASVSSFEEVHAAYLKLKMKYSDATHISCAYRLPGANSPQNQDFIDDGEFGCGRTMLKTLKQAKMLNIVVFMVRYYGGKHLGLHRFDIFRNLTEKAIQVLINTKDEQNQGSDCPSTPQPTDIQQPDKEVQEDWQAMEDWSDSKKSD